MHFNEKHGCYTPSVRSEALASQGKKSFNQGANNNTLKSTIKCDTTIDFWPANSIGRLLGFTPEILQANKKHHTIHQIYRYLY